MIVGLMNRLRAVHEKRVALGWLSPQQRLAELRV